MVAILTILALIVYVGMLTHAYMCKSDIECLSDIAYDKHKWLFPAAMMGIAIMLFIVMLDKTPDDWQFVCFLACLGCVGVGFTPYKDEGGSVAHKAFALLAMASIITLWCTRTEWWMPFLFMLAGVRNKWLLGIEMGVVTSAFAYILL